MKRASFFKNWKGILKVSIGVVYTLFICYLIFHTFQFVPPQYELYWWKVFVAYGVLNGIIVGNANLRNRLFNTEFLKFLPRFFLFSACSIIGFYLLTSLIDPFSSSAFALMSRIPIWLALIHGFVFATSESVIQAFLFDKYGFIAAFVFGGVFHYGIWPGPFLLVFICAGFLFLFFTLVHWRFRKTNNDLAPLIGTHFGYNIVKLMRLVVGG
jgi:hypothetical protein